MTHTHHDTQMFFGAGNHGLSAERSQKANAGRNFHGVPGAGPYVCLPVRGHEGTRGGGPPHD